MAKRDQYKPSDLKALGESLKENGQLHPVLVREHDGKLELLAGTRRMRAAMSVGITTLNATVCRATDAQALELIGVENILRANLTPLERSRYVIELMRPVNYGGGGLTVDQVMKRFGRSRTWVGRTCKLIQLPNPWKKQLVDGKISEAIAHVMFPYLDKPAVLKSIERHQAKNAKQWTTREDWQRLTKMINATFEELGEKEGWSEPELPSGSSRETKATLNPDPYAEERVESQVDKIEVALNQAPEQNLVPRKRLTLAAAKGLISPFAESVDDLSILNRAILERIEELEESSP